MESVRDGRTLWIGLAIMAALLALVATWAFLAAGGDGDAPPPSTTTSTVAPSTSTSTVVSTTTTSTTEPQDHLAIQRVRTSTTRAARSRSASALSTVVAREPSGTRTIAASAYCLRGTMANGRQVHDGAVASNVLPMGSRWRVHGGPLDGRVFTVEDTGGPRVHFDVWMASCRQAIVFGRPTLRIERV